MSHIENNLTQVDKNFEPKECKECGEEINEKRLKARPHTEYCLNCQAAQEAKGNYARHKIEVHQEINGWTFDGQVDVLVRGDD